jgi:RNA polymerase sigma-70 factor (ECF subfamily)
MSKITMDVILSCIDGDRRSQQFIYNALYGKLYNLVYKRLDDKNDVESIISFALTRIFKKLHLFKFERSFEAWCVIITKHAITDFYSKVVVKPISTDYLSTDGFAYFDYYLTDANPSNDGETNILIENYFSLIKQLLTDREYRIFMLSYEGYTHKEIGNIASISEGTSKWYLSIIREKIKKHKTFKNLKV